MTKANFQQIDVFVSKFRKRYKKTTHHITKVLKQKWCLKYFTLPGALIKFLDKNDSINQDAETSYQSNELDPQVTQRQSPRTNQNSSELLSPSQCEIGCPSLIQGASQSPSPIPSSCHSLIRLIRLLMFFYIFI